MTIAQAAEKIGISSSKLYQLVGARQISHYRIGGKIVITDEDVTAYLESCRVGAVTPRHGAPPRLDTPLKHLSVGNR